MNNIAKKDKQLNTIDRAWNKLDSLPWNPQLLRELKGRLKPINIIVATVISLLGQVLLYLYARSQLDDIFSRQSNPIIDNTIPIPTDGTKVNNILYYFDRYCLGKAPVPVTASNYLGEYSSNSYCVKDSFGNWIINWQIWHLEIFIALSLIATFSVLVVGSYLLVADLAQEEKTGSLNFIRLSNQSIKSIFIGKIFGVPSLLYLVFLLAIPFHLFTGFSAGIPPYLILGYYTIFATACFCCYSLAILFGLANFGMTNFKSFIVSGCILIILIISTHIYFFSNSLISSTNTAFDWWSLVYPNTFLIYLVEAIDIPQELMNYLSFDVIEHQKFWGINISDRAITFFGFSLANFALCIYWIWQGIERKFCDINATSINKQQSYLFTIINCFIFHGLTAYYGTGRSLDIGLYLVLQCIFNFYCLGLMFFLIPQKQNLHDWARYYHLDTRKNRYLWKQLIWAEKSPATVAFAVNLLIICICNIPIYLFNFDLPTAKTFLTFSLINMGTMLIYASIVQLMFLLNNKRRGILSFITIVGLIVLPPTILGILNIQPTEILFPWLFTFLPGIYILSSYNADNINTWGILLVTILMQCLPIAFLNYHIYRQIRRASATETKRYLV
jgi:hypothetical protein